MKKLLSTIFGVSIVLITFILPNLLIAQNKESIGISNDGGCLTGMGKNCFEYEKMIGIKDYQPGKGATATSITQDIIFAATYMVGTVLTIVLLFCGFMYIFSARSGKDPSKYKDGLINAGIGAILVWGAYAIVRLIQYIARG